MVNESWPWKRDLLREADDLEKRLNRFQKSKVESPSETLSYRIERFAVLFGFITRKLLDSKKLSQELESTPVKVRRYSRRKRKRRKLWGEHDLMEKYVSSRYNGAVDATHGNRHPP